VKVKPRAFSRELSFNPCHPIGRLSIAPIEACKTRRAKSPGARRGGGGGEWGVARKRPVLSIPGRGVANCKNIEDVLISRETSLSTEVTAGVSQCRRLSCSPIWIFHEAFLSLSLSPVPSPSPLTRSRDRKDAPSLLRRSAGQPMSLERPSFDIECRVFVSRVFRGCSMFVASFNCAKLKTSPGLPGSRRARQSLRDYFLLSLTAIVSANSQLVFLERRMMRRPLFAR